ncbi:hypothetical protein PGB90_002514 [Kerria lacca]
MSAPPPYSLAPPVTSGYVKQSTIYEGYPPGIQEERNKSQSAGGTMYMPSYPPPQGYPPPPTQPVGYGVQPPIINQPTGLGVQGQFGPTDSGWTPIPAQIPANCPSGLYPLLGIDHLFVKQKIELLEAFVGFETNNKYTIKNNQGHKIFYAVEDNDCCTRNCCGNLRSFDIKILDNMKNEVIHLNREFACQSCCFPCCLQKLEVFSPPGYLIGTVEQNWSLCIDEFDVKNESGTTVLKLEGPLCTTSCCGSDVEFKVLSKDKSAVVGKISKQWSGFGRELFTDSDMFGISFPLDLDVRMKAVMLGACFLIDFMYFETSSND